MKKTAIQKAQEAMRKKREAGEKIERSSWIEKSHKNPTSLRLAINGKCWECSNEQREEIRKCPMIDCTLYHLRPYK